MQFLGTFLWLLTLFVGSLSITAFTQDRDVKLALPSWQWLRSSALSHGNSPPMAGRLDRIAAATATPSGDGRSNPTVCD